MPPQIMPPFEGDELQPQYDYTAEIGDVTLRFVVTYRSRQDVWYMSIYQADDEQTPILTGYRMNLESDPNQMFFYRLPDLGVIGTGDFSSAPWFGMLDTDTGQVEADFDALGERCFLYQYDLPTWFGDTLETLVEEGFLAVDPNTNELVTGDNTSLSLDDLIAVLFTGFSDGLRPAEVIIQ